MGVHPCPQHAALVDACVDALFESSRSYARLDRAYPELYSENADALERIQSVVAAFYPKNKKLFMVVKEISKRVQAVGPEE